MLNYAVIIQYLTQQLNIPNVRIAEWLNLDPSIISNIKSNGIGRGTVSGF